MKGKNDNKINLDSFLEDSDILDNQEISVVLKKKEIEKDPESYLEYVEVNFFLFFILF